MDSISFLSLYIRMSPAPTDRDISIHQELQGCKSFFQGPWLRVFKGLLFMRADRPSSPLPIKTIMQRAWNPEGPREGSRRRLHPGLTPGHWGSSYLSGRDGVSTLRWPEGQLSGSSCPPCQFALVTGLLGAIAPKSQEADRTWT